MFDLIWTILGLALLWPLLLLIGLIVKLEDRGPIFFRQRRIGWHGQPFNMWKFRTMVIDAEGKGASLTIGRDPRITNAGHWLRATKVDELPQLFNVLAGEMSLVGPRPEVKKYVDIYSPDQRNVLRLRPGITDLASVKYRRESEILANSQDPERTYVDEIMPEKIRINLEYAAKANVWTDLQVILMTLGLRPRQ